MKDVTNVFVSGRIQEKEKIREIFRFLDEECEGDYVVTHDWTVTDELSSIQSSVSEAGSRAQADIRGVIEADVYILTGDTLSAGKGLYAELGAALALRELFGVIKIFVVGEITHPSVFHHHPGVTHVKDLFELRDLLEPESSVDSFEQLQRDGVSLRQFLGRSRL